MTAELVRPALDDLAPYLRPGLSFYEHQLAGIEWMWNKRSFLLADDMGLGKTLQTLVVCAIHAKMTYDAIGQHSQFLIVCPATLKRNWADEIGKFTDLHVTILNGTPKQRTEQLEEFHRAAGSKFLVVNYEQVPAHLHNLSAMTFGAVIADEAHYLKTPDSQRTEAFRRLPETRRFMLTGTPILGHVDDLWTTLDQVQPGAWGTFRGFVATFCVFGGHKGKQVVGVKNEKRLMEGLEQIMLRRLSVDVLDLPEVQHIQRLVDLLPEQRTAYSRAVKEMVLERGGEVEEAAEEDIKTPMVRFLRLKQICSTTATVRIDGADHSAKFDLAVQDARLITESGEKIVVFTSFRASLACYVNRLLAAMPDVPVWALHGDIPSDDRQSVIDSWGAHEGPAIVVCILQVAGVGLNMTQASNVQFLELDVTPANNAQAIARVRRIGATGDSIKVWTYEAADTVDQRVNKIIAAKQQTNDSIIEASAAANVVAAEMAKEMAR